MTGEFVPKRPHKKSRGGCRTCKGRKIKCDELHPKCTFCQKRDLRCVYITQPVRSEVKSESVTNITPLDSDGDSSGSYEAFDDDLTGFQLTKVPSVSISTSTGFMSPVDLRMMHHWSTMTWNSIAIGNGAHKALQQAIPQLGFEHEYVLQGILGIASLHSERSNPSPEARKRTELYRGKALAAYRKALSRLNPEAPDYEAALIMSLLVVVLSSQDYTLDFGQLIIVKWVVLYQGLRAVVGLQRGVDNINTFSVSPIFQRELAPLRGQPVVPTVLLQMFQNIQPTDSDFPYLKSYCEVLDAFGMLFASLQEDGLSNALYIRIVSWLSYSNPEFAARAKSNKPRALIMLAYYLLFLRFVDGLWWIEGTPDREILMIATMVGHEWAPFMDVPLRALTLSSNEEVRELMLR